MRLCSQIALSSVSVVALAAAAGPAYAQAPVTPSEVEACANLPTQQERDLCVQGQAQGDEGIQETGELATLPAEEAAELQAESDTIVVTGSRLRRSPFNSPDPLTVIDPELSMQEGDVETAEILQNTPIAAGSTQITSFLSSNFVTNGGPGAQTLSLRGLGAERTLVLLDGRRAGPAGVRGAVAAFDLNVLPSSIVRSVEIVKTGASSIYGSDAIAGVVNILTKRETKGLELTGFASLPSKSGGETFDASATYGRDFGRGHFLVSASYFRRNELERRDRDFLGCTIDYSFNAEGQRNDLQDPRTGEPYCGGDAFHNAILLSDFIGALGLQTNLTAPPGTQFPISLIQFNDPGSQTDVFGFPIRPRFGPSAGFQFEAPPGFFGVNVNSNSTGILNLFNESTLQQGASVIPKTDRFTLFGTGSYELTDSVELFADLLYNKRKTKVDSARQLFPQQFTGRTILPQFFCARIPGTTMDDPNDNCFPTDTGDPINSAFRGEVVLTPVIMVPFNTAQEVDYYRGVGGLRGEVNLLGDRPWRWEGWVQHARSDGDYESDIVFQDAFDTFNLRTRSCAGTTTRIRGAPCVDVNFTDPRVLRGDFTDQERDFIFGRDAGNTVYKQWTGELSTTGDLFTLPGGPVQAAVGVHLRRDEIKDVPGEATRLGNSWGLTRADVTAGHAISKEVFGEVDVPLLTDGPIGTVSVSAAGRVTNYRAERDDGLSDKDNGNFTYKLGGNWRLNEFVRVRGTYGTSYRAPALFEQFLGNETGFQSQLAIDPCINWGLRLAQGTISQNLADNL